MTTTTLDQLIEWFHQDRHDVQMRAAVLRELDRRLRAVERGWDEYVKQAGDPNQLDLLDELMRA